MGQSSETTASRIAALNDLLRGNGLGGHILITAGVQELGEAFLARALNAVQAFDAFTPDNDPYGEHDFGSVEVGGYRLFWKIDYYDESRQCGSPDPADPVVTTRVMTIMLAEEY